MIGSTKPSEVWRSAGLVTAASAVFSVKATGIPGSTRARMSVPKQMICTTVLLFTLNPQLSSVEDLTSIKSSWNNLLLGHGEEPRTRISGTGKCSR